MALNEEALYETDAAAPDSGEWNAMLGSDIVYALDMLPK